MPSHRVAATELLPKWTKRAVPELKYPLKIGPLLRRDNARVVEEGYGDWRDSDSLPAPSETAADHRDVRRRLWRQTSRPPFWFESQDRADLAGSLAPGR